MKGKSKKTFRNMISHTSLALDVSADDDEEEEEGEEGEEKMPTCGDYIMHFLTLAWKIIFAFIPPSGNDKSSLLRLLQTEVAYYAS